MTRSLDLTRERCLCGRTLAQHRTITNASISCAELAEREQALKAAACCTTAANAQRQLGVRGDERRVEVRG